MDGSTPPPTVTSAGEGAANAAAASNPESQNSTPGPSSPYENGTELSEKGGKSAWYSEQHERIVHKVSKSAQTPFSRHGSPERYS
jgi:hypothetical protein